MKLSFTRTSMLTGAIIGISGLLATSAASALATPETAAAARSNAQAQTIISAGDREISRRLATLNTLSGKISGATKLNASDRAALGSEVSTEISGLTALKTKLDAETTLDGAHADAQSIVSDYRVYALIVPKIQIIRTADDQQVTEGKLTSLAAKLQTRLTEAKASGKDITELQSKLTDMTTQTNNAQAISSSIETKVIALQPTDYDTDHGILNGDATQLKTAHSDNQAAYADAQAIVSGIKGL